MKMKIKKAIWLFMAFGWWGVLYPELSITSDTCRIVWENENGAEEFLGEELVGEDEFSAMQIYYKLLSAEPEQIKIKSRLLEKLAAYLEKGKER